MLSRSGLRWLGQKAGLGRGVKGSVVVDGGEWCREPFLKGTGKPRWCSPDEAWGACGGRLKSGDRVFIQGFAATPGPLLDSFYNFAQRRALTNLEVIHLVLEGSPLWATKGDTQDMMTHHESQAMRSNNLFVGANMRDSVAAGTADYVPVHLSDIPKLLRRSPIGLALVQVSPPDVHGYCSLGTSVDITRAALRSAKRIIAIANPNMPRSLGDGFVHSSNIDVMVHSDVPLHTRPPRQISEVERRIGAHVAELVEDGATLQIGTGKIPAAAALELRGHKGLGIHSESLCDELMQLVQCGAVTNEHKKVKPGQVVASWCFGSEELYKWLNDNPQIYMGSVDWVNEPSLIAKNPKVTAIASAVQIDLSGQVSADSVGHRIVSGFGGQLDFMRGAARSVDGRGKPILTLSSETKEGESKIVPELKTGAGVVSTRAHVDWVVTEFGAVSLFGKNLRERAAALISIAHPNHRQSLEQAAFRILNQVPSIRS